MKCYNLVTNPDRTATLTMYGEVVQTRPVDWWTGELVKGDYICQDELIQELDRLAGVDALTIHLNSVGGDYYAGMAIRNRIRSLGIKVDTINDSLAASAGSVLMQAACGGGKRKCYASSNMMVHAVSGGMFGYYNAEELKRAAKSLEAADQALIICYAESGTVSEEDAAAAIEAETWLTGQQAVDRGFADEVISLAEAETPVLTNDYQMRVGGQTMQAGWLRNCAVLPENIVRTETENLQEEEETMEIKNMDELRENYPALVQQLEDAAKASAREEMTAQIQNAVEAERERIQSIDEIAASVQDTELVNSAKYTSPMTAEQLAFQAMKKQAALGANMLNRMEADAKNSGTADVSGLPADTDENAEEKTLQNHMIGIANQK